MSTTKPDLPPEDHIATEPLYSRADVMRYLGIGSSWQLWNSGPRNGPSRSAFSFESFAAIYVTHATCNLVLTALDGESWGADRLRELWRLVSERLFPATVSEPGESFDDEVTRRIDEIFRGVPLIAPELVKARAEICRDRVEFIDDVPIRLYPFTRVPMEDSPRIVVMDPAIRFGQPTIAGRGIPVEIIARRFQAGDSIAELEADYDLTRGEIEEAFRLATMSAIVWPSSDDAEE